MDDIEVDFITNAVKFVAEQGKHFLPLYGFDLMTGAWRHKQDHVPLESFSLDAALECCGPDQSALSRSERFAHYTSSLAEARRLATELASRFSGPESSLDEGPEQLRFFMLPKVSPA
ncbi:MAG: hypothetical protein SH820_06940 [Xanthomonadales bacterium]|nr:hypothetical protein [Xanthomonadales bacterium]